MLCVTLNRRTSQSEKQSFLPLRKALGWKLATANTILWETQKFQEPRKILFIRGESFTRATRLVSSCVAQFLETLPRLPPSPSSPPMCPSYWIFLRYPLVTSTTRTHPPTEPISVGTFIYSGKYPCYLVDVIKTVISYEFVFTIFILR